MDFPILSDDWIIANGIAYSLDMDFDRSIREQIEINQARTPTERFDAFCDLLDAARSMAPMDEAARQRRLRVLAARRQERELRHDQWRRLFAAHRAATAQGV